MPRSEKFQIEITIDPFARDIIKSLAIAAGNSRALDAGLVKLRDAVAERAWDRIEDIRAGLLAAVDGYVDNYVAAGRRVEHEHGRAER